MIKEYKLYGVECDLCEKSYPGCLPHPVVHFPSEERAIETIKLEGWVVLHNSQDHCPRILCPECNEEAERVMNKNYGTETIGNKARPYPQQG